MPKISVSYISLTRRRRELQVVLISAVVSTVVTIMLSLILYRSNTKMSVSKEKTCVMTTSWDTNLGNDMFHYAILYSLARTYDCEPVVTPQMKHKFQGCFNSSITTTTKQYKHVPWKQQQLPEVAVDFNFVMRNWKGKTYMRLSGQSWDWRYFKRYEEDVRKEFTFLPDVKRDVVETLNLQRRKRRYRTVTYIGIFVRRRDHIQYLNESDCNVADVKYLRTAMRTFKNNYPDALFIIASDDMAWCQKNMKDKLQFDMAFADPNFSSCSTLALMAQCDHSIMTQGPFSFWSAYLAAGEVIYYKKYCYNNTGLPPKLSVMYLPHWRGIPAT